MSSTYSVANCNTPDACKAKYTKPNLAVQVNC